MFAGLLREPLSSVDQTPKSSKMLRTLLPQNSLALAQMHKHTRERPLANRRQPRIKMKYVRNVFVHGHDCDDDTQNQLTAAAATDSLGKHENKKYDQNVTKYHRDGWWRWQKMER